eukprot:CAMPEP_0201516950 /NCGR_PEP_ID=MMETSP0161_2-20130828/8185_1 /ASSEMBLY_ACC=CAM_ASM_000251 /TAXON_ID=180227 /ORGANISM="Neoparamoeba aestuarina, Strain SoJaBio B1-5/56/2" /LENGTH=949 /DNA_ID=CAMNT_0047914311 /DNA_START=103 /DNA_END=2952 /DNA_ORIENTATION=+
MAGKAKLMVSYADQGAKQHDFSKDRDLKQHTAQLCKLFGIQDSPEPYVISVRQNGQHYKYLSQQDIDSGITTSPGTTYVLRCPFRLVDEVIRDLQNPAAKKHTVFNLAKKHMKDGQVVSEFLQREGTVVLEELVKTETGGTLAFSLQALDAVLAYGKGAYAVTDDLVERVVACLLDEKNIQVKINSLRVCKHLVASEKGGGFWLVHRELVTAAQKREQQPYEAVISALKNEDLNIKVGALNVINAFIEHSPDKSAFEEFLVLIESFGYLEELKTQLVSVQSADFKRAVFWHQAAKSEHWGQEKNIPYDKENEEHEGFLYELWGTCFPDTELESRVSDQWKKLGFQGKDPGTDFRGMGLLGLKHILYFAKTYTKIFVDMATTQNARESHYYPVSTAGINISSMLLEILNIGKGKSDSAVVGGVVTGAGPSQEAEESTTMTDGDGNKIFPILFDHHNALEEMYCLVFRMFNRVWDEMNADYMDFMNVASSVKDMVVQALAGSSGLCSFARALGVADYDPLANRPVPRESSLLDMAEVDIHCKKRKSSQGATASNIRSTSSGGARRKSTSSSSSSSVNATASAESMALASDNVNLDIFVQIANSSTHVTVPRSVLVKEAIELTMKGLKKKVTKKAKKIEPQHFFNKSTGIWLDDHRAVWTYLLKENEKMELKSKPNQMNNRKIEVQIKLESGTKTATLDYVPETTVRGVIQLIEKPNKSIVKDIHLYGLILGSEGSGSQIWLDESRTLTSYGVSNSNNKLVFALRSSVIGGNVTKKRAILLRVQTEMGTKTMQFDENNKAHDVISRICIRMSLDPDQHCLYLTEQNKYMADELPISCYAVTPTQSLVLRKKGYGWLPDKPNVEMLGQNLDKITFRCLSVPSSAPPSFSKWGVEEVCEWLREIGMEDNVVECFEKGNMDGGKLGDATSGSLKDLGIAPLGTRKEIVRQMLKMK